MEQNILVKIGADIENFKKGVGDVVDKLNHLNEYSSNGLQALSTLGKTTTGVGVAMAGGLGVAVKVAADFEQQISRVGALSGASDKEMVTLTDTAKRLGETTVYSATEAADGMAFLAMAGYKTNDIIAAMPGLLNMAAAGQTDLGTTADITSNILQGFGIEASKTGDVADVLTKAFTSSNVDLAMLGETMKYVAPQAAAAGYSMEEMAAASGLLGNAGIQASMAGTSLRSMIERFSGPVPAATKLMKELGIEVVNSDGTMKSLADIVDEVTKGTADLGDAQRIAAVKTLVGSRASASFLALMEVGGDTLRDFTGELENAGGTAAEIAAKQLDNLYGSITLLKSALEGAAISIGSALLPAIRGLTKVITTVIGWFNSLSDSSKSFIAIGTALTAVLALIVGPILILIAAIPSLIAGFSAIAGVLGFTAGAFALIVAKVALVIGAIVAVGAALVLLYNECEWFRNGVNALWDGIVAGAVWMWVALKTGASAAVSGMVAAFHGIAPALTVVGEFVRNVGVKIGEIGVVTGQALASFGVWLYNGLISGIGAVGRFIAAVGDSMGGLLSAFSGPIEMVKNYIADSFSSVGNVILTLAPIITRVGLAFAGLTGPVGWVIATVLSLGIAIARFVSGNEAAQSALMAVWNGFKDVVANAFAALQPLFDIFAKEFGKMATELGPQFAETGRVISESFSALGPVFAEAGDTFAELGALIMGIIPDIVEMGAEFAQAYMEIAAEVLPLILSAAAEVFPAVLTLVMSLFTAWTEIVRELVPVILDLVQTVLPQILEIVSAIFPAVLSIVQSVIPVVMNVIKLLAGVIIVLVTEAIPLILSVVQAVFPAVLSIIMSVIPIVLAIIESLVPVIINLVTAVIPLILSIVEAVFPVVLAIIQAVIPLVMTILEALAMIITSVVIPAIEFILNIVQIVFPAIVSIIEGALNIIMGIINVVMGVITGDWSQAWEGIKQILAGVWEVIKSIVTLAINLVVTILTSAWELIKSVTTAVWNGILSLLSAAWEAIKTLVSAGIEFVKSILNAGWEFIKSVTSTLWNGILTFIKETWEAIKTAISNAINTAQETIESVWNAIKDFIDGIVSSIKDIVSDKFDEMVSAIGDIMDTVKGVVEDGWNKAKEFLDGIDLYQIGSDIIDGLVNGIKGAVGKVGEAIKGVASSIPSGIKSVLGIKSPSRVMRDQVGKWIPIGLADGIAGATASVMRSVDAMTKIIPREIDAPNVAPVEVARPNVARTVSVATIDDNTTQLSGNKATGSSNQGGGITLVYNGNGTREQADEFADWVSERIAQQNRLNGTFNGLRGEA